MPTLRLFLAGDVMTGRGIDQVLRQPSDPRLLEPFVRDARGYVELAEQASGPIPRRVAPEYIWGEALAELERERPDVRIVNLETSVTTSDEFWPGKSIHYRMHPANIDCLTVARIDCCVLANNHVLDFGREGLSETLRVLRGAGLGTAGAGENVDRAAAPCDVDVPSKGRVRVFAFGFETSGIPFEWAAGEDFSGVNLLGAPTAAAGARIGRAMRSARAPGDVVVASVHWGGNWGFAIPDGERAFAHALIDSGGADVVHGHSSHHPKAIEIYRDKPILYGCGDLITDYEGISGHETYRPDLSPMYFVDIDTDRGALADLTIVPMRLARFSLRAASPADIAWLVDRLNRDGRVLGSHAEEAPAGRIAVRSASFRDG